jgi:ATP/maltotriose-dependent transcriptional regulator MalT
MVEAISAPGLTFRFTHELVRRALYDRLSAVRAAEVHLRVGEALEQTAEPSGRILADLAHHFTAAAPLGGSRAIHYNLLAARAAVNSLAFDQAAAHLQVALDLGPDTAERATLFLELGYASHRGGKVLSGLSAFRDAVKVARHIGRNDLLAMAAIGYEEACWRPGIVDQGAIELLEEAAEALDETRDDLRVGLLAGLARALDFQGHHDRAAAARVTGMASARERGDCFGLATVLVRSYWAAPSVGPEQILGMLNQAHALAEDLADTELRAEAKGWRVPTFVALGDLDSARAEISSLHHIAEQTAQPFYLHVADHYASAIALSDGYLDQAEALAHRSHDWSRLLVGRDATGVHGIQMFSIRREQGRLAELAPIVRILARDGQRQGPWRPGLAALLAELGMADEARRELSRVAEAGLDPRREPLWLASLTYLTDACTALADPVTAAMLYPQLEPYSGTNIMIGHLVSCYGAADRYLGMLAAVLGEVGRAERHFERAMEMNREMGALTWLARTVFEYGRHLLRRRPDRAQILLAEAAELARRIGMAGLLQKATTLQGRGPMTEAPDGLSDREAEILAFVARGLSNREIGSALFISEHTAANHVRNILRKTGCANRTEATSYAHRHSLVDA